MEKQLNGRLLRVFRLPRRAYRQPHYGHYGYWYFINFARLGIAIRTRLPWDK